METTRRGRRRPWNSFSLNWALKAVKESCCRLPSLAGSCQMNPGGGMNGSGTCMNFGTDIPAPTSRFVELGLGKSGGYYFLPLDLNWSRQVSIAVMPLFQKFRTSVRILKDSYIKREYKEGPSEHTVLAKLRKCTYVDQFACNNGDRSLRLIFLSI